eukprot:TRINITY_DN33686_c0_g2_i1.p1 TRINITY_DN33686_c0_g2~~TRINITY_DN33686_c0_g2_i1.p1  ORF type:complete len:191 (-),score=33.18 TRINITY_DN33686_c0_g2_i1:11-517(-)
MGTSEGSNFRVLVCITDNTVDTLGICTKCGSMSMCGSKDQIYPDKRTMGYPVLIPLTVKGKRASLLEAEALLKNWGLSNPVRIINRDTRFGGVGWDEKAVDSKTIQVIMPSLLTQLEKDAIPAYLPARDVPGVVNGTYTPSSWTGSFREIGRAVQQECRDRSRMPSSA